MYLPQLITQFSHFLSLWTATTLTSAGFRSPRSDDNDDESSQADPNEKQPILILSTIIITTSTITVNHIPYPGPHHRPHPGLHHPLHPSRLPAAPAHPPSGPQPGPRRRRGLHRLAQPRTAHHEHRAAAQGQAGVLCGGSGSRRGGEVECGPVGAVVRLAVEYGSGFAMMMRMTVAGLPCL